MTGRAAILIVTIVVAAWQPLWPAPSFGADEEPEILTELDRRTIYQGESVVFEVTLNFVEDPREPDLSAFTDFQVTALGEQDINSTQTYIVNGRRTVHRRFGRVFRYRITPKSSGVLQIPSPTAEVDGKKLFGRALSLEVIAPEEQELVILSLSTDKQQVYLLQPFEMILSVLVRSLPGRFSETSPVSVQDRAPALTIPFVDLPEGLVAESNSSWLSHLIYRRRGLSSQGTGFSINGLTSDWDPFRPARFELKSEIVERPLLAGGRAEYYDFRLSRTITPREVGEFVFAPANVKGLFGDRLDPSGQLKGREIYAVSNAVTVQVLDAPLEGRPQSFSGAVGRFTLSADVQPRTAKVGDPITLTLSLSGAGTLERAIPPEITTFPEVARGFKVYEATEESKGSSRIFTYSLRPLDPGITAFPPVSMAYFDVERERYVTLHSESIPLEIEATEHLDEGDIVAGGASDRTERHDIEQQREGIFADVTDLAGLRDQTVYAQRWALLGAGLLLAYGLALVGARVLRARYADPAAQRRRSAASRTRQRLREAHAQMRGDTFAAGLESMKEAVRAFVGDVCGVTAEGMTPRDVRENLTRLGLETAEADGVTRILEESDAARYGGLSNHRVEEIASGALEAFEKAVKRLQSMGRLK